MSIPLWLQCTIFWCTSSRIMHQSSNHLRLVSWTWQWVHFTQITSTVTRSQSNRAPLGCGGTRDSHHGCADDKSAATVWCYHDNMNQNLWGMFTTPCWICATRIKAVLKAKGVQPGTSQVYLIKWPVSVCIYWLFQIRRKSASSRAWKFKSLIGNLMHFKSIKVIQCSLLLINNN